MPVGTAPPNSAPNGSASVARKRNDLPPPAGADLRAEMLAALRNELVTASRERHATADGLGFYASAHDEVERKIRILEAGEPLEVWSQRLPAPWRDRYRPPRRVAVGADGSVNARHPGPLYS